MAPLELEVPVFSPGSAQVALTIASRIELNRAGSYPQGGLTPELSDVQSLAAVSVPLRISKQVYLHRSICHPRSTTQNAFQYCSF